MVADTDAMKAAPWRRRRPPPGPTGRAGDPDRFVGPLRRLRRLRPAAGQTAMAASLGLVEQQDRLVYQRWLVFIIIIILLLLLLLLIVVVVVEVVVVVVVGGGVVKLASKIAIFTVMSYFDY